MIKTTNTIERKTIAQICIRLMSFCFASVVAAFSSFAIAEQKGASVVGYATVEEAYIALEKDESAVASEYEGWVIYNQKMDGRYILWSFTPIWHPANPSVVRREIVSRDEQIFIEMSALCESLTERCDEMIEEFKIINENIRRKHGS